MLHALNNDHARRILVAAREPMTAQALAEECEISLPTVYRRANELAEQGLLAERTRIDPEGHHTTVFETNLEEVCFHLGENRLVAELHVRKDAVDRFEEFWRDLGSSPNGS